MNRSIASKSIQLPRRSTIFEEETEDEDDTGEYEDETSEGGSEDTAMGLNGRAEDVTDNDDEGEEEEEEDDDDDQDNQRNSR